MRAIVVSGGTAPSKKLLLSYLKEDDFLIGVDKGCNCLYNYGLKPNLILGDFDSVDKVVIKSFKENGIEVLEFNPEKDYTDSELGYIKAKENGADEILFFGATGSRIDHSLGNIGILLKALRENIKLEIIDDHNRIFLIDSKATIKGGYGDLISFHALSDVVKNIDIKNAKYELRGYDMKLLEPRAICNEFLNKDIEISFDSGTIMVIFPKD
jgi:thiamine pyrophosphokinase